MTKKQDFYPLPGFPVESKFDSIDKINEYLHGEKITCLICGRSYKSLPSHVTKHGISIDDYKIKYGLPFKTGLTSSGTKSKLREGGLKNIPRLDKIRVMIDRSKSVQRISAAKILQSKINISKAPVCVSPFSIDDAITIFKYMVEFNVSLNEAVKSTKIMKMTAFWNLLERHPEELVPEYEIARSLVSKGQTNPLTKNKIVIADIRGQMKAGVPRSVIAEKYGIHEEYVTVLNRGFRGDRKKLA